MGQCLGMHSAKHQAISRHALASGSRAVRRLRESWRQPGASALRLMIGRVTCFVAGYWVIVVAPLVFPSVGGAQEPSLSAARGEGRVEITAGRTPVATYFYRDERITRPYFAHLKAPGGVQVTRAHPPVAGADRMDHPEYHPGLWLAFGDLGGADNWRLEAPVEHVDFLEEPVASEGHVAFAVRNRYLDETDPPQTVCQEVCRYQFHATPAGYLLTWDSTFFGESEFTFGDQEEMGLGVRVATPLRVESGGPDPAPPGTGTITDSEGRTNAAEVWGEAADWVDYSGALNGAPTGVAVFAHPDNFRATRYHARDYGFITANPFAIAAFDKGEPSRVVVKPGESLRLRYGVLLHAGSALSKEDLDAAYAAYVTLASQTNR